MSPPPTSIPLQAYFILFLIHENLGQVPCMEQGPDAMPGPQPALRTPDTPGETVETQRYHPMLGGPEERAAPL